MQQGIHSKYIKVVKVRFFQRVVNGIASFFDSFINGLCLILKSPAFALQAFANTHIQVMDNEKLAADLEKQEEQQEDEESHRPTLRLEVSSPDDDEEWKKDHNELYRDGD